MPPVIKFIIEACCFKICFDQIFVFLFFMGGFNRRCNYDQADYLRLCHTLSYKWPPLEYHSKLAKKHSIVFKTLPIHFKTNVSTCCCLNLLVYFWLNILCLNKLWSKSQSCNDSVFTYVNIFKFYSKY